MNQFFDYVYDKKPVELRNLLNRLSTEKVSRLLSMQYAPEGTEKRLTPLMISTVQNSPEIATVLLEKGADPNQMCLRKINELYAYNGTPLWVAASFGHLEMCRVLIAHGANINLGLAAGMSPLTAACAGGHIDIVKLFISEHGVDMETSDREGNTPLMGAAAEGRVEVVRFLLVKGARTETRNNQGVTAIQWAARLGHAEIVSIFVGRAAAAAQLKA